jgi:hypothetical protein
MVGIQPKKEKWWVLRGHDKKIASEDWIGEDKRGAQARNRSRGLEPAFSPPRAPGATCLDPEPPCQPAFSAVGEQP